MKRPLLLVPLLALILLGGLLWSTSAGGKETMRPVTAPVAFSFPEESLGPDELCALFPQDQGYDIRWTRSDACDATRGDCLDPPDEMQTCVDARILVLKSPQDARETLGGGRSVSGLGDAAVEYVNDRGEYWLWFHREEYLFFVMSALGQTDAAKAVAQHVDRLLKAVLSEGLQDPGSDGALSDVAEPPSGEELDIAGVFFGATHRRALTPRIVELIACSLGENFLEPGEHVGNLFRRCKGGTTAWEAQQAFLSQFAREFENPTSLQTELGVQVANATLLAGLEGKDGKPLFPSVGAAMPLIKKLADRRTMYTLPGQEPVAAVGRFIDLLVARDAAGWEKRFPPGADSSSGGGGAP